MSSALNVSVAFRVAQPCGSLNVVGASAINVVGANAKAQPQSPHQMRRALLAGRFDSPLTRHKHERNCEQDQEDHEWSPFQSIAEFALQFALHENMHPRQWRRRWKMMN
ncbi:MAG: hypothetical protein WA728_14700 [Xanthobacteraceae bacterium]